MDFHCLSRKILQQLCKKNKIHANMTNVAMADALHSLQTVQGLDQILQNSSPERSNPPRSCRRDSSTPSKRADQEIPSSSARKRSRVMSPTKAISRKKEEVEEDPSTEKAPPFSALTPCGERLNGSVEVIEDVSVQKPVLECSSDVPRNDQLTELAGVREERTRSIGIQVDIEDIDKCLLEMSAHNCLEFNQCLEVAKKDQEATTSCYPQTDAILDKECIESSGLQNLQVAISVPEQTPAESSSKKNLLLETSHPIVKSCESNLDHVKKDREFTHSHLFPTTKIIDKESTDSSGVRNKQTPDISDMTSNLGNLYRSQKNLVVKICEPDDCNRDLALNLGLQLEGIGCEKRGFNGIHSDPGLIKKDPFNKVIDKECVASSKTLKLGAATHLPVPGLTMESSNMPSNQLLDIGDPIQKSHEPEDSIRSLALNCSPLLEDSEGEKRQCVGSPTNNGKDIDSPTNNGKDIDMERENEETKSGGVTRFEVKTEKTCEKKRGLSGLSLRKLRCLYKESKEVIKLETEGDCGGEEEVQLEEKQSAEKAMMDGLSLRKLKFLYKNKATNNRCNQGM